MRKYIAVRPRIEDEKRARKMNVPDLKGTSVDGGGALTAVGKGASIGATVGSAVPVPGVGTAVGSAVGALAGLGTSIFGDSDEPSIYTVNVIPKFLAQILKKKGIQAREAYPKGGENSKGVGGLKVEGTAVPADQMMQTVRAIIDQMGRQVQSFRGKGQAQTVKRLLYVTDTRPPARYIIVSFPVPQPAGDAATRSQTPTQADATNAVPAIGIAAVLAYLAGQ